MEGEVRKCCLTVAGSDSGGNAGVQADLRVFHAYGLHGCTVFSALTAQNPFGVSSVLAVPPEFVAAQLDAVLGTYSIAAMKTGMIPSPEIAEVVADRLSSHLKMAKVVDPVMVATSGACLANGEAVENLKKMLLPLATVITPNIPEASAIAGIEITGADTAREAAKRIYGSFGAAVLVKGGHFAGDMAGEDLLYDGSDFRVFSLPWIPHPVSTHGTGCSLAAAIAAELALGKGILDAVKGAKSFVHRTIENSYLVGPNCGVLGFSVP